MGFVDPLTKVYVDALGQAVEERGGEALLREVGLRLSAISTSWRRTPTLRGFFLSAKVPSAEKERAMARLGAAQPAPLGNFLRLLLRRGRLAVLHDAGEAFDALLDRRLGRVQVTLTTATPVPENDVVRWQDALRTALGREPVLRHVVRPDLVGGAVLRAGDVVLDGSVRRRLADLRRGILQRGLAERGAHAIQP